MKSGLKKFLWGFIKKKYFLLTAFHFLDTPNTRVHRMPPLGGIYRLFDLFAAFFPPF
jgi:hypothetical protein